MTTQDEDTIDNANDNAFPLEDLMVQAASNPDASEDFYDALVDATVFIPGAVSEETDEGPELELHVWVGEDEQNIGDEFSFIPVFTSAELLEEAMEGDEVPYLSFTVRDFLAAVDGVAIVINPDSEVSLTLDADELDALRDAYDIGNGDDEEGDEE